MILAIIQNLPNHPQNVVQTRSFAQFQAICGMIEQTSYLAAHAACHASMNGMDRTLAVDADIDDEKALMDALEKLFPSGSFDALVIPGLTDFEVQKRICDKCQKLSPAFQYRLFCDPERHSTVAQILEHQKELPDFARYAWPWVSTVTPGRRSAEWLPPSCLIAPLALGCSPYLKGVHDLSMLSSNDIGVLLSAGVEMMGIQAVGHRPVIARLVPHLPTYEAVPSEPTLFKAHFSLPDNRSQSPQELAIQTAIEEELQHRCTDLIVQYAKNDASLWSALQRTATSVLNHACERGWITRFRVRCDEETASWGTPEVPVVEVQLEFPKRVREIRFRVS